MISFVLVYSQTNTQRFSDYRFPGQCTKYVFRQPQANTVAALWHCGPKRVKYNTTPVQHFCVVLQSGNLYKDALPQQCLHTGMRFLSQWFCSQTVVSVCGSLQISPLMVYLKGTFLFSSDVWLMVVAFSSPVGIWRECSTIHSLPAFFLVFLSED